MEVRRNCSRRAGRQVAKSAADLGLLFEYLYDGREEETAPVTVFDDDLFFGARPAMNDVQDTQIIAGPIIDREDQSTLIFIEASRRLGQHWKAELESRLFQFVDNGNPLASFKDDSFITLRLSRFF